MDLLELFKNIIYAGAAVVGVGFLVIGAVFVYAYSKWRAGDYDNDDK